MGKDFLGYTLLFLMGLTILALPPAMYYGGKNKEVNQKLIKRTIEVSAGQDRIWSQTEKREFLDSNGLYGVIMQEGEDIYFRPNSSHDVDVIAGYNLENNGSVLVGSSAKSGRKIGTINQKNLEQYITSNQ